MTLGPSKNRASFRLGAALSVQPPLTDAWKINPGKWKYSPTTLWLFDYPHALVPFWSWCKELGGHRTQFELHLTPNAHRCRDSLPLEGILTAAVA